jgi:hypothetical protein
MLIYGCLASVYEAFACAELARWLSKPEVLAASLSSKLCDAMETHRGGAEVLALHPEVLA